MVGVQLQADKWGVGKDVLGDGIEIPEASLSAGGCNIVGVDLMKELIRLEDDAARLYSLIR
jgi:hypothetical protein